MALAAASLHPFQIETAAAASFLFSLLCFFPSFVLKDINHGNGLRRLAVLLVCGIMHPIILEKGKKKRRFAHWNCVGE